MKKLIALLTPMVLLTACATTGTTPTATTTPATTGTTTTATPTTTTTTADAQNPAMAIFSQMMDAQCRAQLNAQPIYQNVSAFITPDQKAVLENKVCGCVSEESLKNMNLTDVISAGFDKSAQTRVITQALGKTLQVCATKFITG